MTIAPFGLVYSRLHSEPQLPSREDSNKALSKVSSKLRHAIATSAARWPTRNPDPAVDALAKAPAKVITAGFWDLGSRVTYLPELVNLLNEEQQRFLFFEIHASIPAGLVSRPERVKKWAEGIRAQDEEPEEIDPKEISSNNVIDDDFFKRGEPLRRAFGLDYLIGVVPSMVAGVDEEEEGPFWDHFASTTPRAVLASTYGLREYARRAKKPFESAVGLVTLSSLFVGLQHPRVNFHHPDTGCFFDYNEDRDSLVRNIRNPFIEKSCLNAIKASDRDAALAFTRVLKEKLPERIEAERSSPSTMSPPPPPPVAMPAASSSPVEPEIFDDLDLEKLIERMTEFGLLGAVASPEPAIELYPQIPSTPGPRELAASFYSRLRSRPEFKSSSAQLFAALDEFLATHKVPANVRKLIVHDLMSEDDPDPVGFK